MLFPTRTLLGSAGAGPRAGGRAEWAPYGRPPPPTQVKANRSSQWPPRQMETRRKTGKASGLRGDLYPRGKGKDFSVFPSNRGMGFPREHLEAPVKLKTLTELSVWVENMRVHTGTLRHAGAQRGRGPPPTRLYLRIGQVVPAGGRACTRTPGNTHAHASVDLSAGGSRAPVPPGMQQARTRDRPSDQFVLSPPWAEEPTGTS